MGKRDDPKGDHSVRNRLLCALAVAVGEQLLVLLAFARRKRVATLRARLGVVDRPDYSAPNARETYFQTLRHSFGERERLAAPARTPGP